MTVKCRLLERTAIVRLSVSAKFFKAHLELRNYKVGWGKLVIVLPGDGKKTLTICAVVATQYRHWTDRQTDRQTDRETETP